MTATRILYVQAADVTGRGIQVGIKLLDLGDGTWTIPIVNADGSWSGGTLTGERTVTLIGADENGDGVQVNLKVFDDPDTEAFILTAANPDGSNIGGGGGGGTIELARNQLAVGRNTGDVLRSLSDDPSVVYDASSSGFGANPDNARDPRLDQSWSSGFNPLVGSWLEIDLGTPVAAGGFRLIQGLDSWDHRARGFVVEYFNGATWTAVVDVASGMELYYDIGPVPFDRAPGNSESPTVPITAQRWRVRGTVDAGGGESWQIVHFSVWSVATSDGELGMVPPIPLGGGPYYLGQGITNSDIISWQPGQILVYDNDPPDNFGVDGMVCVNTDSGAASGHHIFVKMSGAWVGIL